MYLNNKVINFSKSEIINYTIEDDKDLVINFIISFVKECNKHKFYQSSLDIYNLLKSNIIKNLSNIKNYINKNKSYLQGNKLPIIKENICLVTYIYDDFNTSWFEYITSIFDNIFVINYSNKSYHIKNCKILKSTNYDCIDIDTLLLCNDLKYHFNKLVILEEYQKIGLIMNNSISYNVDYIKEYLNYEIKNNILIKKLIKIDHETYIFNEHFYLFKCNINHVIFKNSTQISKISKTYSGALIICNNILNNNICQKNIHFKYSRIPNYKLETINTLEEYIYNYYENDIIKMKIKFGDLLSFLKEKYNAEIYKPISYNFIRKHSNLIKFNHYDYQFFNESIIVKFCSNLENDFLLLLYFIHLANRYKKKIFIKWNHDLKLNEIINDDMYLISDCNDNVKNYEIKKFESFDSNILLHNITYINTNKINSFSIENKKFIKLMLNITWHHSLVDEISKINELYKNDNIFLIDLNEDNTKLIPKVIGINSNDLFQVNSYDDIKNNKFYEILFLYILVKTKHIIYDKYKEHYKFLVSDLTDFNKLLYNSHLLYKENDEVLFKKIDYGISSDNLIITNINDNIYLNFINDSKFISKANIIANDTSWDTYKFHFITNITSLGKCLNTLIDKSKEKYIIISLKKKISTHFFYYNILKDNQYYYDNDTLYINRTLFEKINGFNENIANKDIFNDFCTRCKLFNYENITNITINYELLSFWGKENMITGNISRIKKNFYLIK